MRSLGSGESPSRIGLPVPKYMTGPMYWSMALGSWILGHVRQLQYLGGAARCSSLQVVLVILIWRFLGPNIEGLKDFKGPIMHSARWDHKVDFAGKSVGVIGKGSSAVQIIPQIQPSKWRSAYVDLNTNPDLHIVVKDLQVFMRPEGTWISPPFGFSTLGDEFRKEDNDPSSRQYHFSEEQKRHFAEHPEEHLRLRRKIECEINTSMAFWSPTDWQLTNTQCFRKFTRKIPKIMKLSESKWQKKCFGELAQAMKNLR